MGFTFFSKLLKERKKILKILKLELAFSKKIFSQGRNRKEFDTFFWRYVWRLDNLLLNSFIWPSTTQLTIWLKHFQWFSVNGWYECSFHFDSCIIQMEVSVSFAYGTNETNHHKHNTILYSSPLGLLWMKKKHSRGDSYIT